MMDMQKWMQQYQDAMWNLFESRILLIGLQGSCGREEAHEDSDIDVVLILDVLSFADLERYKRTIDKLSNHTQICGFVSGKEELKHWCRSELFQFYYDTTAYFGSLDDLIMTPTRIDAGRAVLTGACNLYHMTSHQYLYHQDIAVLKDLYKSAMFVLQAKYFAETGNYIRRNEELEKVLVGMDLMIWQYAEKIKTKKQVLLEPDRYSEFMLHYTQQLMRQYKMYA